jgi:hypothetical protein
MKCILLAGILACCAWSDARLIAAELPNPFTRLEALEQTTDRKDPHGVEKLIEMAQQLSLHGMARRYARELLLLRPDHEAARALLHDKKFLDQKTNKTVWLNWFDAAMWQTHQLVRDQTLGYYLLSDREAIGRGLIRAGNEGLLPVDEWDRRHSAWASAHEADSRFFHVRSTIPWAAVWYVADDLDRLTLAYLDLFEIERFPRRRFDVHLYRSEEDANAAGADGKLLATYGAYYSPQQGVLHVSFDRLGALTAVRHEMAHALNREFVDSNPVQWFDEGVGVMCQFARPTENGWFEFGRFPRHGFSITFINEVKDGSRERMAAIHSLGHVTTNAHYYSEFRSMIDFFMTAENKKYRMTFLNTFFRHQGDVARLVTLPAIDDEWTEYVSTLEVDPDWHWMPFPTDRAKLVEKVLKSGTSAAAFADFHPETN